MQGGLKAKAVARDAEAVREAARKSLAAPSGQALQLPLDEAQWLSHLAWLRSSLGAGVLEARDLTADEAEGLRILAEVEREMASRKACPRCGALCAARFTCESCGAKLGGNA